jgi:O-succinylbenzoic acid--CoA ligase
LPYRQLCISCAGEILVKGEVLFKGYVNGQRLNLPLTDDGWFATGDMGQLDAQSSLSVTGRRDNMFISGGENIQPEEIEKFLLGIKGVAQAVVVPKADGEFGHRPIAFIKYDGEALSREYMVNCLQANLPRFKIPTAFYPWPQELISRGIKVSRQEFLKTLSRCP